MSCVECPQGSQRHDELKADISIVNCIVHALDHNFTKQAFDEALIFQRRLERRHLEITGRDV